MVFRVARGAAARTARWACHAMVNFDIRALG
eukprot:SAG31_NODE_29160_length_399_cov_8.253333_1_plen_30_part_10